MWIVLKRDFGIYTAKLIAIQEYCGMIENIALIYLVEGLR